MGIRQFATSLSIIYRSENPNRAAAVMRHLFWQIQKLRSGPISRRLSHSILTDEEPGGVISEVNMLGLYNFNNMNFLQIILQDGGVFVDVGANIGSYTLIASENPKTTVLSIEPNPIAFRKLKRNIVANERGNVTAINVAASKCRGVLRMTGNGGAPTNRIVEVGAYAGQTIEIHADTLDDICDAHGVSPRLIKIDVEGHEPEVLEGASRCLPWTLACIIENADRPAIRKIMSKHSMRGPFYYHHRVGRLLPQPQSLPEDSIYLSADFEAKVPQILIN